MRTPGTRVALVALVALVVLASAGRAALSDPPARWRIRMCGARSIRNFPHGRWLPNEVLPRAWTSHANATARRATGDECKWIKLRYLCPNRTELLSHTWVPDIQLGGHCLVPDVDLPLLPQLVAALQVPGATVVHAAQGATPPRASHFRPTAGRPFRVVVLGDSNIREQLQSLMCRFRDSVVLPNTVLRVARGIPRVKYPTPVEEREIMARQRSEKGYGGRCHGYVYSEEGWEWFFRPQERPAWLTSYQAEMAEAREANESTVTLCTDEFAMYEVRAKSQTGPHPPSPVQFFFQFMGSDPQYVLKLLGVPSEAKALSSVDVIFLLRLMHRTDKFPDAEATLKAWAEAGFRGSVISTTHFADHRVPGSPDVRARSSNDSGPLFQSSTACADPVRNALEPIPPTPLNASTALQKLGLSCDAREIEIPSSVRIPSAAKRSSARSPDGSWAAETRMWEPRSDLRTRGSIYPPGISGRTTPDERSPAFHAEAADLPIHVGNVPTTLLASARPDAYPVRPTGAFDEHVCVPGITDDLTRLFLASVVSNEDWWLTEETIPFLSQEQQAALREGA